MNQKSLIVVESPSKARTIEQYLDGEFEVVACVGHVKDLPTSKLGIDIENNFEMTLDVLPKRRAMMKMAIWAKGYFGKDGCLYSLDLVGMNVRVRKVWCCLHRVR